MDAGLWGSSFALLKVSVFSREGVGARGLLPGTLGLGIGALAAYATQHFQKPQDYPQRSNPPQIKPFKLSLSRRRPRPPWHAGCTEALARRQEGRGDRRHRLGLQTAQKAPKAYMKEHMNCFCCQGRAGIPGLPQQLSNCFRSMTVLCYFCMFRGLRALKV